MSRRFRKAVDMNQGVLVRFAEAVGFSVLDTHNLSGGLDLLVGFAGIDQRVEVKNPDQPNSGQKLTENEEVVFRTWAGRCPVVWRVPEDVLETRDALLREACQAVATC